MNKIRLLAQALCNTNWISATNKFVPSLRLRIGNSNYPFLLFVVLFASISSNDLNAQVEASSNGFNYFDRAAIAEESDGAGYSFYAAVWPIMQQYPGPENFQLGLPSTWLKPFIAEGEPEDYYNTIEGGLGWWHDTRFATETPKFIMGGVAFNFNQWANGTGAGSSDLLPNGQRDWTEPGGKYGVAQLSPHLLWPPDGLNMEQGANGAFLGYGYHPLPLTDPMPQTNGANFFTGNQCWTLFLNTTNFKGPATFFIPTFWTETILDDPDLQGLFFDAKASDKNPAFAMEYLGSPALIGSDNSGVNYARILPLVFPKTSNNGSELIRDIKVYTKDAKWNEVEQWFNGGPVPPTEFQLSNSQNLLFSVDPFVDGQIGTENGNPFESPINYNFAEKVMNPNQTVAGFQWDINVVSQEGETFVMPEFYRLNPNNQWDPVAMSMVPASTGLLNNEPAITPKNDEIPYLTPLEPDCHLQDPQSPWNSPGPSAGPFTVELGDGSVLTYHWYRFIDQPSIVHAKLPEPMRQSLQERVEKIHTHWNHTDEYLPAPSGGNLVGLDPGLIVTPPAGMDIGYVPIVTRQEKNTRTTAVTTMETASDIDIYPNPFSDFINIESRGESIYSIQLFNAQGQLMNAWERLDQKNVVIVTEHQPNGVYFIKVTQQNGAFSNLRIIKNK